MLIHSLLLAATVLAPPRSTADGKGRVQVWTENGSDPYRAGERARVFIRGEEDGYITVFRVDTDGRIQVLFPRAPWMDNFVRGDREYEIEQARNSNAFDVDDSPGVGYVFAVSSPEPFAFDAITEGDHWDYRAVSDGRIHGDPYVALTDLAGRILPAGDEDWDYDISPYYVERHYDYPRFLCYDCHAFTSVGAWDPYAATCPRFRIVAYDDPVYYPYRYYQGRSVVVSRPLRPEPRFVFKDRDGVGDDQYVTVTRDRPRGSAGRDQNPQQPDHGQPDQRRRPPEHQPPPPRPEGKPQAEPPRRREPPHQAPPPQAKSPPPKEQPPKGQPELRRRKPN